MCSRRIWIFWALETLFLDILAEFCIIEVARYQLSNFFVTAPICAKILCFGTAACGLSLSRLVLFLSPRGFSPVTPAFPGPQNHRPTFPNSNLIWKVLVWYVLIFYYNTWSEGNHKADCPFNLVYVFIFWQIILLTRLRNELKVHN